MKKMMIIFSVIVMAGCSLPGIDTPLIVPEFSSEMEAMNWVHSNIEYVKDRERGYLEYWQSPEQTLYYRTGDCDDMSILFADILKNQFNAEPYLWVSFIPRLGGFHMRVYSGGVLYDPTAGIKYGQIPTDEIKLWSAKY